MNAGADEPGRFASLERWPLGRLLSTAARLVEQDWNAVLAEHGLTHAGLVALAALRDGALTQRELAVSSRVEEQTISRVVEKLERGGYVDRRRDSADRRRMVVSLSPTGLRTLRTVMRTDVAERLVAERVQDPERFRAELVRLVERSGPDVGSGPEKPSRVRHDR